MAERPGAEASIAYSYAFQPIVDIAAREVHSYEALIRGPHGESAGAVLSRVPPECLHAFDRESRGVAVAIAGRLGIGCHLNLNVLPGSLRATEAQLRALTDAAAAHGVPASRMILEVTEGEAIVDHTHFASAIDLYRSAGLQIAIDDFGAGYSGLNLLADFQPDLIKLDMNLVRDIASRGPRQSIVRAIVTVCDDLGIAVVAEGVESATELTWLAGAGVSLFQGYLLARPGFECLPEPVYPG